MMNEMLRLKQFVEAMAKIRKDFPEHSYQIDRCVFEVGQKLDHCGKPNCECQITFEEFHLLQNQQFSNDQTK